MHRCSPSSTSATAARASALTLASVLHSQGARESLLTLPSPHMLSTLARHSRVAAGAMRPSSPAAVAPLLPSSPHPRPFSVLTASTINPRVLSAQYAVRGELVQRAETMKAEIAAAKAAGKASPYPFESLVQCNIGNPQELGQKPLTFHRQVLSLAHYPDALSSPSSIYPSDAIDRAKAYLAEAPSTGAYTASSGLRIVRAEVAAFIAERDGHPADADAIFLTDGASTGAKNVLSLIVRSDADAVLTPIPQYPLYSATLTLLGGHGAGYYLDESKCWSLSVDDLRRASRDARALGKDVRALVVINPGNPTGQVLEEAVMRDVVRFCEDEGVVLMADEVYQENVYAEGRAFVSFKRVLRELRSQVQLVSFHSTSKGFIGECGQRGGYMELVNFPREVLDQVYKLASISLCSNTSGQLMTGLMVNPPKPGSPSHARYASERDDILSSLRRRATIVADALNGCTGISCQPVQGAMYAFPSVRLPAKAVEEAKRRGKAADTFYCLELLQHTGLVTVPGSGFGQREGEWHFRMTILPREEQLSDVLRRLRAFNEQFMAQYAS